MKQWLQVARAFKITSLLPKYEIGREGDRTDDLHGEVTQLERIKKPGCQDGSNEQRDVSRRKQAFSSSEVKFRKAEITPYNS